MRLCGVPHLRLLYFGLPSVLRRRSDPLDRCSGSRHRYWAAALPFPEHLLGRYTQSSGAPHASLLRGRGIYGAINGSHDLVQSSPAPHRGSFSGLAVRGSMTRTLPRGRAAPAIRMLVGSRSVPPNAALAWSLRTPWRRHAVRARALRCYGENTCLQSLICGNLTGRRRETRLVGCLFDRRPRC